ncbi:hypothetical protein KSF78_0005003 [Schistosoma japonicum]
MLLVN